jgi:hypothetical protein
VFITLVNIVEGETKNRIVVGEVAEIRNGALVGCFLHINTLAMKIGGDDMRQRRRGRKLDHENTVWEVATGQNICKNLREQSSRRAMQATGSQALACMGSTADSAANHFNETVLLNRGHFNARFLITLYLPPLLACSSPTPLADRTQPP